MTIADVDKRTAHLALISEFRRLAETVFPDVAAFMPASLPTETNLIDLPARPLPVVDDLQGCRSLAMPEAAATVDCIIRHAKHFHWQQSYTHDDGFDDRYLATYGWINLVSPVGPFVSDQMRITLGCWGPGLHYREHWHEPEEIYALLAGRAHVWSEGREAQDYYGGDTIIHTSNQPHAMHTLEQPLLAFAVWRGQNLMAKPTLAPIEPEGSTP